MGFPASHRAANLLIPASITLKQAKLKSDDGFCVLNRLARGLIRLLIFGAEQKEHNEPSHIERHFFCWHAGDQRNIRIRFWQVETQLETVFAKVDIEIGIAGLEAQLYRLNILMPARNVTKRSNLIQTQILSTKTKVSNESQSY